MAYDYDELYRLTRETVSAPTGGATRTTVYEYDKVGNRTSMRIDDEGATHTHTDVEYEYDERDRLTTETRTETVITPLDTTRPDSDRDRCFASQRGALAASQGSPWARFGLIVLLAINVAACCVPLWYSPLRKGGSRGVRARRRRRFLATVAMFLVPVMAIGPETVLALHYEALLYQTVAAIGQPGPVETVIEYSYDANGNLIEKAEGSSVTRYTYDALDTTQTLRVSMRGIGPPKAGAASQGLVKVDKGTGPEDVITYAYDTDGIRIAKTVGANTTHYLVDKNRDYAQVLEERNSAGNLVVRYVYGNDLISQTRGTETRYYHYDGQMSTRLLTKEGGVVTDTYSYDAFGLLLSSTAPNGPATLNDYLYTGEQYDPNAGFYHLRARYYDPAVGRFTSADTFDGLSQDPPSLHKYLYASANPVNRIDPSGCFSLTEINFTTAMQGFLQTIRVTNVYRAWKVVDSVMDAVDMMRMFTDVVSLLQSGGLSTIFNELRNQAASMLLQGDYADDLRKLRNLSGEHLMGIARLVAERFPKIVSRIKANHGDFLKKALKHPGKATLLIGMPSLPGEFVRSIPVRIPLPLQVGPFKLEVVQSESKTGGSLGSFGMKFGSGSRNKIQLFRIDYHGTRRGNEPDAFYFQVGPRLPGQSHEPWFHYHTPNY